jgi:hypothetical protein
MWKHSNDKKVLVNILQLWQASRMNHTTKPALYRTFCVRIFRRNMKKSDPKKCCEAGSPAKLYVKAGEGLGAKSNP